MTLPASSNGASPIPFRATGPTGSTGPSRPGTRPANSPAPVRPSQNAFAQALMRAQAQNLAFRGAAANASGTAGTGTPADILQSFSPDQTGDPSGLPLSLQGLMQQAVAASSGTPAALALKTIQVPGGYGPLVQEAAQKYGVDPALIAAVIETESKFNPDAVSQAGAKGLMQLMPATARGLGVTDPSDPRQAILGGAKLLGILTEKYGGKLDLALAAYNAGSGAVDKHGGIPPYAETQKYVPLVLSAYERYKAQLGTGGQTSSGQGTGR